MCILGKGGGGGLLWFGKRWGTKRGLKEARPVHS